MLRRRIATKLCLFVALVVFAAGARLFVQGNLAQADPLHDAPLGAALDALIAAYPYALAGHDAQTLRWRDGTLMPLSDGDESKSFSELLRHASIIDQLRLPYPRGPLDKPPALNDDPGRFRSSAFFSKMYGDCRKGAVAPHLVSLPWLPKSGGKSIRITSINGVDRALRAVSAEIDALPDKIKHAAYPIAGTYNCRAVADTGEPSPHSYGIAIDLNTAFSDYWYWRPHDGPIVYRNRMPQEIVSAFEKHGFIWGGKWYHYDTMHFEYRPELLAAH
jgi:D-alanyl-D-alanine carboxypeptidase